MTPSSGETVELLPVCGIPSSAETSSPARCRRDNDKRDETRRTTAAGFRIGESGSTGGALFS